MGLLDFLFRGSRRGGAPVPDPEPGPRRSPAGAVVEHVLAPAPARPPVGTAYVVLDVETTGLSPESHRIVQIALLHIDETGGVIDEFSTLVNPEGPVGATHIHGIRDVDVVDAPVFRDIAATVVERIGTVPVVAHNARFDLAFLRAELSMAGWDVPWIAAYCTMQASRRHLPGLERRRLADCSWAVGHSLDDAHSALADARAAAAILRAFLRATGGGDPDLVEARREARATAWTDRPTRRPRRRATVDSGRDTASRAPRRFAPPRPRQPALLSRLNSVSLQDVLDEGAPDGAVVYLETLCEALEDGVLDASEAAALEELRVVYELSTDDVSMTHRSLLLALAHSAVDDGRVTADESAEILALAPLLGADDRDVRRVLASATRARVERLSTDLPPLPDAWDHGEPLRVGDRIAITGCDETWRSAAEATAEKCGVRVMSAVSGRTALLVTDGVFDSGKRRSAVELGTRTITPELFDILLRHVQPAASLPPMGIAPAVVATVVAAALVDDASGGRPSPSVVRAWAIAQGLPVGVRGRLSAEVVAAYSASHAAS